MGSQQQREADKLWLQGSISTPPVRVQEGVETMPSSSREEFSNGVEQPGVLSIDSERGSHDASNHLNRSGSRKQLSASSNTDGDAPSCSYIRETEPYLAQRGKKRSFEKSANSQGKQPIQFNWYPSGEPSQKRYQRGEFNTKIRKFIEKHPDGVSKEKIADELGAMTRQVYLWRKNQTTPGEIISIDDRLLFNSDFKGQRQPVGERLTPKEQHECVEKRVKAIKAFIQSNGGCASKSEIATAIGVSITKLHILDYNADFSKRKEGPVCYYSLRERDERAEKTSAATSSAVGAAASAEQEDVAGPSNQIAFK